MFSYEFIDQQSTTQEWCRDIQWKNGMKRTDTLVKWVSSVTPPKKQNKKQKQNMNGQVVQFLGIMET